MPSLAGKVAQNTIIQFSSKILGTILGIFSIALITRYLGKVGFGEFTTVTTFLQFFGIIVDMGLSLVAIQMISEKGSNESKNFNNLFTFRLITAFIVLGLAPLIGLFFPYPLTVKIGLIITTASVFFTSLNQLLITIFQKNLNTQNAAISEITSRIILILGCIIVPLYNWGLYGILITVVASNVINFAISYFFVLRHIKIKLAFDLSVWKDIYKRSWPLAISIFFNLIYLKADTLILSVLKPQADVGVYGAAYRVLEVLITFPMTFLGLIMPSLAYSFSSGNKQKFGTIIQKAFDFLSIIAIPLAFGTIALANPIMKLVAGNEFEISGSVLQILIIATSTIFLSTLFGHIIVIINKQKVMLWGYLAGAIFGFTGYLITIPIFGYYGAAWMTVAVETLIGIIAYGVFYRSTKIKINLWVLSKSLLASIGMFLLIKAIPGVNLLIQIIIASLSYFLILYLIKGFSKEDIREIINIKK